LDQLYLDVVTDKRWASLVRELAGKKMLTPVIMPTGEVMMVKVARLEGGLCGHSDKEQVMKWLEEWVDK
jgi:hypothetical protein